LAAALSIPLTATNGTALPRRDLILVLATAVIVLSLVVQGLTLEPLVRFAGIARPATARHEESIARVRLASAGRTRLDELATAGVALDLIIHRVRASLQARNETVRDQAPRASRASGLTERELRSELIAAENAELARLYAGGAINEATRRRLQAGLDLDAARLSDGQH